MYINYNENLKKYTTIKLGGIAEKFYVPESNDDLIYALKECKDNYHLLANGSNILMNDKKIFQNVVYMNEFNKNLEYKGDIIRAGASVKLQQLINFLHDNNLGGIEYLYSVPATIGGAVYMNAGRGKSFNKSISDYIVSIKIYDGKSIKAISKEECDFSYRNSIFKRNNWIILEVDFKFEHMNSEEGERLKRERIEHSKKYQHSNIANAGTVFCDSNNRIMSIVRKINIGWKDGIKYSYKTDNWLINNGKGTYKQAKILINFVRFIHKIMFKNIKLEYIEWK